MAEVDQEQDSALWSATKKGLYIGGAVLGTAVFGDDIADLAEGMGDFGKEYVAPVFDYPSELAAKGLGLATGYEHEVFQNLGLEDGGPGGLADVAGDALNGIKELGAGAYNNPGLTVTAAATGAVGTYAMTRPNRGQHTARVNAERGEDGTIATVARRGGHVFDGAKQIVGSAADAVGGVAKGVKTMAT